LRNRRSTGDGVSPSRRMTVDRGVREQMFWDEHVPPLDEVLAEIRKGPDPNDTLMLDALGPVDGRAVLDFACGTGVTSAWLARRRLFTRGVPGVTRLGSDDERPLTREDLANVRAAFGELETDVEVLTFARVLDRNVFGKRRPGATRMADAVDNRLKALGAGS